MAADALPEDMAAPMPAPARVAAGTWWTERRAGCTDQREPMCDDDDDMNAIGAVCDEPVITIGVDGEKWDECEHDEESYVDDVNGGLPLP